MTSFETPFDPGAEPTFEPEPIEYDFPETLPEAELALNDIIYDVQSIQEQLGNRDRTTAEGVRLGEKEYWTWRHKAAGALRHRQDELRALKLHIRDLRIAEAANRKVAPSSFLVYQVIDSLVLARREGRLDDAERFLLDLTENWVIRRPADVLR